MLDFFFSKAKYLSKYYNLSQYFDFVLIKEDEDSMLNNYEFLEYETFMMVKAQSKQPLDNKIRTKFSKFCDDLFDYCVISDGKTDQTLYEYVYLFDWDKNLGFQEKF